MYVITQAHNNKASDSGPLENDSSTSQPYSQFQTPNPLNDMIPHPLKGNTRITTHNLYA